MPEPRACDDLELTGDRLNSLEEWKANADLTIWQLTEQVRILTGRSPSFERPRSSSLPIGTASMVRGHDMNLSDRVQEFTKGTQKWPFTHETDDRNADRLDQRLAEAQATAESELARLRRKLREA